MMKALSLTRPWPWAFINGPHPKRVENRSWKPPTYIIGKTIALHAAKSWDEEDREYIADVTGLDVPPRKEHPDSLIFAVCRIVDCLGEREAIKLSDEQFYDWFFGPFGWLIEDFYALPEPVPCKGAPSLWSVPPEVEVEIRQQIGNAPAALAAKLLR
jgi:activating signal cointegrator 1